jgi:hypothetical protein
MASDTHPETAAVQREIFRRMTTEQRFRMALEMSESLRARELAQLRSNQPDLGEPDLMREFVRERYGILLPRQDWTDRGK